LFYALTDHSARLTERKVYYISGINNMEKLRIHAQKIKMKAQGALEENINTGRIERDK
jgi:hypothetical protein